MTTLVEPIREASRQLVRELHLLDGRHCIEGFTFSECHLLTELDKMGQATAKELGERLVLEKSTMSRLVKGLQERGCIESHHDPADRRQRLLRLTETGKESAGRVHLAARAQVLGALDFIGEAEAAAVAEGLRRYARGLMYQRLGQEILIRPIVPADNPVVADIIRQVMTEYGAVGPDYSISDPEVDAMHQAYPPPRSVFYVIERTSKDRLDIQGCGGIAPLKGADASVCELQKMYFRRELRGTGSGSRLLNMLLQDARRIGYRQCYLETLDRMTEARRLYAKHGFEAIDSPMGATGHSGCNSWMIKAL